MLADVALFGNWKANGTASDWNRWLKKFRSVVPHSEQHGINQCLFLPFTMLAEAKLANHLYQMPVPLGAQTVSCFDNGAHTGEISASMLSSLNVQHVLIGHSERRRLLNETTDSCRQQIMQANAHAITPVYCIGESLEQREQGRTHEVLQEQLQALASPLDSHQSVELYVAYEPVWAIGTGKSAELPVIEETLAFVHEATASLSISASPPKLLYGGSVNDSNAVDIVGLPSCSGLLIGGASLDGGQFGAIVQSVAREKMRL